MKKLTKREKFLLFILALFIILTVGVAYLIVPEYTKNKTLREEIDTKEQTLIMYTNLALNTEQVKSQFEEVKSQFEAQAKESYPLLIDEDVDKLFTGLLKQTNVESSTLNFSSYEPSDFTGVHYRTISLVIAAESQNFIDLVELIRQNPNMSLTSATSSSDSSHYLEVILYLMD